MATAHGIVTRVGNDTAWVKSQRSSACEACSARSSCNTTGCDENVEVEAINLAGAKVGDRIVVSFETASLIKVSFFLYIFPIICLLIGALGGQQTALMLDLNPSLTAAGAGFACLAAAIAFIRFRGRRMSGEEQYTPKITRIIH